MLFAGAANCLINNVLITKSIADYNQRWSFHPLTIRWLSSMATHKTWATPEIVYDLVTAFDVLLGGAQNWLHQKLAETR